MKKLLLRFLYTLLTIFILLAIAGPVTADFRWPFLSEQPTKSGTYSLSASRLFPKTLELIDNNYIEPERIEPKEMLKGSLDELQKSIPEILIKYNSPTNVTVTVDQASKKFSSSLNGLSDLWNMMKEIFAFLELNYKGDVKLPDIESIAINGALQELDPHSAFLTPEVFNEFQIDTGGQFGGLGIVITSKDGQLTVITPIEDTPAWSAGIKSGDIITQIGEESTINMSLTKAVEKLRGPTGSKIAITVKREGRSTPFKVLMVRAKIKIDSVKATLINDVGGNVGYIKLKRFQKETSTEFERELARLKTESAGSFKGLILDLRNNPGGLLDQAVKIADIFLSEGTIVSTVGARKKFIESDEAHEKGTESADYPIIVLINEGSASASEIVAGALRANNRALVLGTRSFGKGSVQSVYELGDSYALKLTIAQYLTAGKYSIQTVGITPDIAITPANIGKDAVDIIPNELASEKELDKHLNQIQPIEGGKKIMVSYFSEKKEGDEELEEKRRREYASRLEFKDDFAVKLATKMILAAKSPNPEKMIEETSAVVGDMEKLEDAKISSKLSELGTDWTEGKSNSEVKLTANSHIEQDGKTVVRALAGKKVDLVVSITNNSDAPVYKLLGVIESENPLLKEKEFAFGKIDTGKTSTRKLTIDLPENLNSSNIPFKLAFKQHDAETNFNYSSDLKVTEVDHPRFAINYALEKPKTVDPEHPLPVGKTVPLSLKIKNIGTGTTKELEAFISNEKNDPDLFIEKGRAQVGALKPGEIKKADFAFHLMPSFSSAEFTLDLALSDRQSFDFMGTQLAITTGSGDIAPAGGIWYESPKIDITTNSYPIITSGEKYTVKGKVTCKTAVKDYYIVLNDEKVAYRSNPEETNELEISEELTLKKGNNNVTVVARDLNKISGFRSFVIQSGTPEKQ